ncbi:hypothetical protein ACM39_12670 [Chryseobacterium sp. FH2]|uniref:hypothetical protein n=1 Tax=Chryseobacterium sp. FH2 TaxID=1674291 RepID=UPI00065B04EE|nr:hypothetical protein [Chryseobacterium sp. FH2]KMQ67701.1 hypothetical protein ACM39_12670 [Chryseobacterium sp. FH2]
MKKKKLSLNKEKIVSLSGKKALEIQGGKILPGVGSQGSTNHDFTCCFCTAPNSKEERCFDPSPSVDTICTSIWC